MVFGSVRDLHGLLGFGEQLPIDGLEEQQIIQAFMAQYGIEWFTGTRRIASEDKQFISGMIYTKEETVETAPQLLQVLDRIGAGDAYAAGILLGYAEKWPLTKTADFAITNAVLAHTMLGDVPLITREQVEQVLKNPGVDLFR